MNSPQTHGSGFHTYFIIRLHLKPALSHMLTQHSTSAPLSEPGRHGFTPQKGHYSGVFGRWSVSPFCLLKQAWIWTWVLTSLMSGAPRLVPEPFQIPLCNQSSPPQLTGREAPSPESTWSGGTWHRQPSQWARDTELETRRWKHHPPNPRQVHRNVSGGHRQRLRGHQSFWGASLLSKLAATKQTRVQRLSSENKGGLSYIPCRAGYRNGGATACSIHNHKLFHSLF
jgi:hypothetical protein